MATKYSQGGWYDGRQFWDGVLGAPGVVMDPSSPGYLKPVSSEVNKQSDAAQGYTPGTIDAYLAQLRGISNTPISAVDGSELSGVDGIGAGGSSAMGGLSLQGIYDEAYKTAGISDLQKQYDDIQAEIDAKNQALADKTNSINENPWGAEGTRIGKVRRLTEYANDSISVLQQKQANLATKINQAKADVETKLNLATKQQELNKDMLSTFNSLLSMGALDSASSDDIAQFARQTGLPTSFLASAIKQNADKGAETKLIESTDDNGNVTVSLVSIKDGKLEVTGKQNLGAVGKGRATTASAIKSDAIATAAAILDTLKNSYGHVSPSDWATIRSAALQSGLTAQDFNNNFSSYTDPNRTDFSSAYGFDLKSRGASQYQIIGQE